MDTKLEQVVAYDRTKTQKFTSLLVKNYFRSWIFSQLRIVTLILNKATIRLLLLVREKEPLINIYKFLCDLT